MKRLWELPSSSIELPPETPGSELDVQFKGNPKLAGIIIRQAPGERPGVISRTGFYQQMSRRTAFDIFQHRAASVLLPHIPETALELHAQTPVAEAVERCLERPPGATYEPLLVADEYGKYRLVSFNELILAQSQMLEHTMEEIAAKNRQVQDSIRYAERIQHSMIFNSEADLPEHLHYETIYRPRDIVSGDFYWICQANNRVYIALADCTGHGVPGAFMSLIGHGHLSSLVQAEKYVDPSAILRELHLRVRRSLHQERSGNVAYDGMEVALCVIDVAQGHLDFAGAKRPLAVTRANGQLHLHKGDRYPIGGRQRERHRVFTTLKFPLESNATYYLYTDGWTDQCDAYGVKFGTKRLKATLGHVAPWPLAEQRSFLESALDLHQKNTPQRDDIALLAFQYKP